MDGWMGELMDKLMDGCKGGRMGELMDRLMGEFMDKLMDGWDE
jgi:hypothetical protein